MNNGTDLWTVGVILALAFITLVTRTFFFISRRSFELPHWAQRGLQYAPIAALAAVIAPEVLVTHGELVRTFADARLFGAAVATAVYFLRLGTLPTIAAGMAVYLPLHLGLGW